MRKWFSIYPVLSWHSDKHYLHVCLLETNKAEFLNIPLWEKNYYFYCSATFTQWASSQIHGTDISPYHFFPPTRRHSTNESICQIHAISISRTDKCLLRKKRQPSERLGVLLSAKPGELSICKWKHDDFSRYIWVKLGDFVSLCPLVVGDFQSAAIHTNSWRRGIHSWLLSAFRGQGSHLWFFFLSPTRKSWELFGQGQKW